MKTSSMLVVTNVSEERTDKNGIPYKQFHFATPAVSKVKDSLTGEIRVVRTKVKRSSAIIFGKSYIELVNVRKKTGIDIDKMKDKDIKDVPSEFGYDANEGEYIAGDIVTKAVEPYEIPDEETGEVRTVSFYTCPVLGNTDEESFDQEIKRAFKRNGHELASEKLSMTRISTENGQEEAEDVEASKVFFNE